MPFSVKDKATEAAVRRLAKLKRKSQTETIREAVENEYDRVVKAASLVDRLRAIGERYARYSKTGSRADRAFFNAEGGNL
jgi:antitoxin VapB